MDTLKCRGSATIIIYVPLGVSLPGVVRRIMELGGRIHSVNEEARRILASAPLPEARRILDEAKKRGIPRSNTSVEVSLACRGAQDWRPPKGFLARRYGNRLVAAGVCGGRIVFAELKNGLLIVKLGREKPGGALRSFPGPGELVLPGLPGEEEIGAVLGCVLGGGER